MRAGIALAELGRLDAAEAAIADALRSKYARAEWYYELAAVRAALGKDTPADIAFARYELLTGHGGYTSAVYHRHAAELLLKSGPQKSDEWKRCGELYLVAGAPQEAAAMYRKAVAAAPTDAAAYGGLATALLAAGDNAEANDAAQKACSFEPHHQPWHTLLRHIQEAADAKKAK